MFACKRGGARVGGLRWDGTGPWVPLVSGARGGAHDKGQQQDPLTRTSRGSRCGAGARFGHDLGTHVLLDTAAGGSTEEAERKGAQV